MPNITIPLHLISKAAAYPGALFVYAGSLGADIRHKSDCAFGFHAVSWKAGRFSMRAL